MKINYRESGTVTTAGLARLQYRAIKRPKREGELITLPKKGFELFQLTPRFEQFLLIGDENVESDSYKNARKAWFGGTDEQPFLVELTDRNWPAIWRSETFYETIKPHIIKLYEKLYGEEKTLRQGDMFCYPFPIQNLDKLESVLGGIIGGQVISIFWDTYDTSPQRLYGTRHKLISGIHCDGGQYMLAKGIMTAPDHKPLRLKKICLIAQTENLKNSKQAD